MVAYRLASDALRKFPGPLLARFTSAYGAIHVWRRDFHLVSVGWHKKYGPVVRVAPDRLVFSSAQALQDIYNNPVVSKGRAYTQLLNNGTGPPNLLTTLDKTLHRQKRKVIAPVVSERSMRVFEPEMVKQVDSFLVQLMRSQGETVDVSHRCERLGVDIIGQLAFGYPLNTQADPTHRVVIEGLKRRSARNQMYFWWSRLRAIEPVLFGKSKAHLEEGFHRSLMTMMNSRMALPKDAKHDFWALASGEMIASGSAEPGLIGKELWMEAIFFVAAGGATTATTMSGIFFYLSRNPEVYARLASEIRNTFSSGDQIRQGPKLAGCKYLRAVIEETLRISPPTLAPAWREQDPDSVAAGEPFIVDGHVIPPGTQVAVSNYTLQHSEEHFPNPYSFTPERWLSEDPDPQEQLQSQTADNDVGLRDSLSATAKRRAFAPFSLGDRSCAGKPMAYLEMSLTIAKTMWYFDFDVAPGPDGKLGAGTAGRKDGRHRPEEYQVYDGVIVSHYGPSLVFKPRAEHAKELDLLGEA